jgi:hypothetical protein
MIIYLGYHPPFAKASISINVKGQWEVGVPSFQHRGGAKFPTPMTRTFRELLSHSTAY